MGQVGSTSKFDNYLSLTFLLTFLPCHEEPCDCEVEVLDPCFLSAEEVSVQEEDGIA